MSNSAEVLLIAAHSRSNPTAQSSFHVFGDPRILQAGTPERLKSALEECELHAAIIADPVAWADTATVVQQVRDRFPDCFVLIMGQSDHNKMADEALKLGLIEYVLPSHEEVVGRSEVERRQTESPYSMDHVTMPYACEPDSQFLRLLTKAGVGVFCCTVEGKLVHSNQAFRHMMDASLEHPNQTSDQLSPVLKADSVKAFLQRVVRSESFCQLDFSTDGPVESTRFYRLHARRISGPDDSVLIEGLMEDITNLRLAETLKEQSIRARERLSQLSAQERNVLNEVVSGAMNKSIARRFDISEKTVERHRSNLMKKLEVSSVAELVRLANIAELENEGFP